MNSKNCIIYVFIGLFSLAAPYATIEFCFPEILQRLGIEKTKQESYSNNNLKLKPFKDFVFHDIKNPIALNPDGFIISRQSSSTLTTDYYEFHYSLSKEGKELMSQDCYSIVYYLKGDIYPVRITEDCTLGKLYEESAMSSLIFQSETEKFSAQHNLASAERTQYNNEINKGRALLLLFLFFCLYLFLTALRILVISDTDELNTSEEDENEKFKTQTLEIYLKDAISAIKESGKNTIWTTSRLGGKLRCGGRFALILVKELQAMGLISDTDQETGAWVVLQTEVSSERV